MTVDVVMYDEPKMPTTVNSNSGANISPSCQAGNAMLGDGRVMNIEVVYNQALKKGTQSLYRPTFNLYVMWLSGI
jgi:hypothetical protein